MNILLKTITICTLLLMLSTLSLLIETSTISNSVFNYFVLNVIYIFSCFGSSIIAIYVVFGDKND